MGALIESISVTLDEMEDAIESLETIKNNYVLASKVANSLMSKVVGDAKIMEEAANAMNKTIDTALNSMAILQGIMQTNKFNEMSISRRKNLDRQQE